MKYWVSNHIFCYCSQKGPKIINLHQHGLACKVLTVSLCTNTCQYNYLREGCAQWWCGSEAAMEQTKLKLKRVNPSQAWFYQLNTFKPLASWIAFSQFVCLYQVCLLSSVRVKTLSILAFSQEIWWLFRCRPILKHLFYYIFTLSLLSAVLGELGTSTFCMSFF